MLSFRRVGYGHANCPPGGRRRLLLAGAVGAVAAPDAIVDPREADERPGDVRIVDTVVSPGEVRGETAELRLGVDLRHRGSAVENVTVRHRAIGADSGTARRRDDGRCRHRRRRRRTDDKRFR